MTQTERRPSTKADIQRFERNYRDEVDGAALYRLLESAETDENLKALYGRLAESEDRHLALWERKLREAGADVPAAQASFRVRFIGWLARRFGTQSVAGWVARMEASATAMYDDQPEAVAEHLPEDERSHARIFREISRHGAPQRQPVDIARIEGRHRGGTGNALRAAVLGVNDGLMTSVSLVMGVAGANPGRSFVLLAGLTGLLAGAFSMALGEWLSVKSSAEAYERQLEIERDELREMPEEEEAELTLIYQAKGFSEAEARAAANRIIANPQTALDTLAREELGMSAGEVGNPWVAGGASFVLFSVGGLLPVLPWVFVGGVTAVVASGVLGGLGLFAAGAVTSLFTGRSAVFMGGRQLGLGAMSALVTFGIGKLVGVNVTG